MPKVEAIDRGAEPYSRLSIELPTKVIEAAYLQAKANGRSLAELVAKGIRYEVGLGRSRS